MKKITKILLIICCTSISSYAQDLRKFVMKSDLILFCNANSVNYKNNVINDFTTEHYLEINSFIRIIKNTKNFKEKKLSIRRKVENEDYFETNYNCTGTGRAIYERDYYEIIFLKKLGNQYEILGRIDNEDTLETFQETNILIEQIDVLDKIKTPRERYIKTVDYFIENNEIPNSEFEDYYKKIGIIKDSLEYSDLQLLKAKDKFLAGNENLYEIIKIKYKPETVNYFIEKLNKIKNKEKLEYEDYNDFRDIISLLNNNFDDQYNSPNYIFNNLLTSEIENYEKNRIMEILINCATENNK